MLFEDENPVEQEAPIVVDGARRSTRVTQLPSHLRDYELFNDSAVWAAESN